MKKSLYWYEFVIVLFTITLFLTLFMVIGGWNETGLDRYCSSFFSLSIVTILNFFFNLAISSSGRLSAWTISLTATASTAIMTLVVVVAMAIEVNYLSIFSMITAGLFSLIALGSVFSILMTTSRHYGRSLDYFSLIVESLFIVGIVSATTFIF
jgi:hypothetical protein